MEKIKTYFLLIYFIGNFSISFSQKTGDFIFEAGATLLLPKLPSFNLDHEKVFADDINFHLKVVPSQTFSYKVSAGYQVKLFKKNKQHITLPVFLSYKRIQEKNKQFGEYYGGYAQVYFYGNRELDSRLNIVSVSAGLNYAFKDNYKEHEWLIEALVSLNVNLLTRIHKQEMPISAASYFSSGNEKYINKSRSLYPSVDLKVARLFKIKNVMLGPFLGYNFNFKTVNKHLDAGYSNTFDNAVYNLQYYHFMEAGFRVKF